MIIIEKVVENKVLEYCQGSRHRYNYVTLFTGTIQAFFIIKELLHGSYNKEIENEIIKLNCPQIIFLSKLLLKGVSFEESLKFTLKVRIEYGNINDLLMLTSLF